MWMNPITGERETQESPTIRRIHIDTVATLPSQPSC